MKPNIVAIATDANQFPAAAFLADRLAALNPRDDTEIVIFTDAVNDIIRAKEFGLPTTFYDFRLLPDLPSTKRWPAAAFIRIVVPHLVGNEVRRILYLDTDIYPENDRLFRLLDLDMGDFPVAAVRDIFLSISEDVDSLNSGVLLIDRTRFVRTNLKSTVLKIADEQGLADQVAINQALDGRWLELSPAMNMLGYLRFSYVAKIVAPAITHFAGKVKPWHGPQFADPHPARAEIEKYLLRSPWKSFLSKNFGFQQAWDNLRATQGLPTHAAPIVPQRFKKPSDKDLPVIRAYLLRDFADVKQGITRIDLSHLAGSPGMPPR